MISGMSAIGTKRTSRGAPHMSAFDPKRTSPGTDIKSIGRESISDFAPVHTTFSYKGTDCDSSK